MQVLTVATGFHYDFALAGLGRRRGLGRRLFIAPGSGSRFGRRASFGRLLRGLGGLVAPYAVSATAHVEPKERHEGAKGKNTKNCSGKLAARIHPKHLQFPHADQDCRARRGKGGQSSLRLCHLSPTHDKVPYFPKVHFKLDSVSGLPLETDVPNPTLLENLDKSSFAYGR